MRDNLTMIQGSKGLRSLVCTLMYVSQIRIKIIGEIFANVVFLGILIGCLFMSEIKDIKTEMRVWQIIYTLLYVWKVFNSILHVFLRYQCTGLCTVLNYLITIPFELLWLCSCIILFVSCVL